MALRNHCIYCGRFVGEGAIEIQKPSLRTAADPDGWSDTYCCAPGTGCNPPDQAEQDRAEFELSLP